MKISANQAQSGGALPLKDIQNQLDPIKGSDLEEKFLDLLAQLFQGANLHDPRGALERQIPLARAVSAPVRELEVQKPKREDSASEGKEISKRGDNEPNPMPTKPGSVKAESDAKQPESDQVASAPKYDEQQAGAAADAADQAGDPLKKPVEKCGNSLVHKMVGAPAQSPAEVQDLVVAEVVDQPEVVGSALPAQPVPEQTVAEQAAVEQSAAGAVPEVAELVKKILAEIRKALAGQNEPKSLADAVSSPAQNALPFDISKQLLGSSGSQPDNYKNLNLDLAALITKLKQIDPQARNGSDLLKQLTELVAKGGMDQSVGSMMNNLERSLTRPVKMSPLAETAGKKSVEIIDKIKEAIAQATRSRDGSALVLNLNPKDLGEVAVRVQQRDDQIFAKISPKAPEVQEIVRAKIEEIVKVLTAAGFKADQLHISVGSGFNLSDNGSRFAPQYQEGDHSGAPKWSRREGREERAPEGSGFSRKEGSNSGQLAGWVA
jgi:flagellar hook-length control protein FliK